MGGPAGEVRLHLIQLTMGLGLASLPNQDPIGQHNPHLSGNTGEQLAVSSRKRPMVVSGYMQYAMYLSLYPEGCTYKSI